MVRVEVYSGLSSWDNDLGKEEDGRMKEMENKMEAKGWA